MLTEAEKATLRTELAEDPKSLGYSSYTHSANDVELARMLNQVRDICFCSRGRISVDEFKEDLSTEILEVETGIAISLDENYHLVTIPLTGIPEAVFFYWSKVYNSLVKDKTTVDMSRNTVLGLINGLTQAGIIRDRITLTGEPDSKEAQLQRTLYRKASRVEELFGPDVKVTEEEVGSCR